MSRRPGSPTESVASEGSIFCGVASPRPTPRMLSGTMFGHVEDAFAEKTLPIGHGCTRNEPKKPENAEKSPEENGVNEVNGKGEETEKKEEGTADAEDVTDEVEAGPMPVSEAVSIIIVNCKSVVDVMT